MMPLWYAETVGMHGGWSPQTTTDRHETKTVGGHEREARMGDGTGRRIRAIAQVKLEDIGKDLSALQAIYGPKDAATVTAIPE